MKKLLLAIPVYLAVRIVSVSAQQSPNEPKTTSHDLKAKCPMHDPHSRMNVRGEQGMGFSQTVTTHHFFLKLDGGVIQVEANSPDDTANCEKIRTHLRHIAEAFASGDFDIPMLVHDTMPPGAPDMKRLRDKIRYFFEETPKGSRIVIVTSDKEALKAIHRFLRFQIEEHKTGDPT